MSADAPVITSGGDHEMTLRAPARARVRSWSGWVQAHALFIVAVAAVLILTLAGIPSHFAQDGWLALVAGREIASHGIPQHDYFTHMAFGVRWTDQQWLAQLVMYLLQQLGGMQLLTVVYVFITGGAFAAALVSARRLGAQDLHVLAVLPLGAFFYLATAVSIRTQGFAYPLFIATLYLLASDIRSEQRLRRTYLVVPILILWANLHGSVTMGVGLVVLYAASLTIARARQLGLRHALSARAVSLAVLAPLTLFATPYGTQMVHYYSVTLMNPEFSRLVTEWKPVTSAPFLAVPLAAVLLGTLFTIARTWRRTPLFDQLVLLVLAVGAIDAVRNITWFGLALLMLLPAAVSKLKGDRPAPLRRARINRVFALAMISLTGLMTLVTLAQPTSWFTSAYPAKAIPTLDRLIARDPSVRIFADVHYADWLIWQDPSLFSGRVAYDTSLELLTNRQLEAIATLTTHHRGGVPAVLRPYGVWVLNPVNKTGNRWLLSRPGVHTVLRTKTVIIATHAVGASA